MEGPSNSGGPVVRTAQRFADAVGGLVEEKDAFPSFARHRLVTLVPDHADHLDAKVLRRVRSVGPQVADEQRLSDG